MALKEQLLLELETNRGAAISGQSLADKFGVSRNAVWKAVTALRKEGYQILSRTNSGYQLADDCDVVSAAAIKAYLPQQLADLTILTYKEIDSTNNEAKRLISAGLSDVALIIAQRQSEGRGRQGRSFYSPEHGGIYLSLIIHPNTAITKAMSITTMAAVAVAEAIEKMTGEPTEIKWVNDLFYQGKKICGILTEAVTDLEGALVQSVIIGIGINIGTVFPEQLQEIASCLPSQSINRNQLIAEIASSLYRMISNADDKEYLQSYRQHSLVLGKEINYLQNGETYHGTALDIDDNGGLIVRLPDGSQTILSSGEISLRLAK